jgi:hypothetical protein
VMVMGGGLLGIARLWGETRACANKSKAELYLQLRSHGVRGAMDWTG